MEKPLILAAARRVDGQGELKPALTAQARIEAQGLRLTELVIDPLIAGWDCPLAYNHFRSGAAPIEALAEGYRLITENQADAVVIRGEDLLRSAYLGLKDKRRELMNIYGDDCSIPEAYTALTRVWLERQGIGEARFKDLAQRLLDNYTRTALRRGLG
ncbi:MAG: hypothetical protein R3310_11485, partial [Candidatus Competibacteraceae bacterium]|nr:hypothetical protein [Candidatus Competibacteraceae bacterium]